MNRIHKPQGGFTLVEMIIVMVITGIIGGIVAIFIRAPVQGYVDSARRADMTDIADTALRRIARDLRLALPNSVRVTVMGGNTFLEFIPTTGGGRYRSAQDCTGACVGDALDFSTADVSFDVIGPMPTFAAGDSIVVYNMGQPRVGAACAAPAIPLCGLDAYQGDNRAACAAGVNTCFNGPVGVNPVTLAANKLFPQDACQTDPATGRVGGCRFHVVSTPVTYVCVPAAGGGTGGTLTRYWGYPIQAAQPTAVPITGASSALLANNVSSCSFDYNGNVVAQRYGLVTMNLSITENGETVTLYSATHVSNVP